MNLVYVSIELPRYTSAALVVKDEADLKEQVEKYKQQLISSIKISPQRTADGKVKQHELSADWDSFRQR